MGDLDAIIKSSMDAAGISESAVAAREAEGGDGDDDNDTSTEGEDNGGTSEPDDHVGSNSGDASVGDTGSGGDSEKVGEKVVKEKVEAPHVDSAEEKFAKEHGLEVPKKGKDNRIPYSRTIKIIEKANKEFAEAMIGGPITIPDGKTIKDVITEHVTSRNAKFTDLEQHREMTDGIEQVMSDDPERFLQMLPYVNPRYAELIGKVKAAEEIKEVDTPLNMPEPDYDLGNGQKTYTPTSLQAAIMWAVGEGERRATTKLEKRFGPIVQRHESDQALSQAWGNLEKQVKHAEKNWKGFTEYAKEINQLLATDRSVTSLHEAYIKIKTIKDDEKLAAALKAATDAETTARAKFMKEQTDRPTGTSAAGVGSGAKKDDGELPPEGSPDRLDAIIKREMKKKLR